MAERGRILRGDDIRADVEERPDVCVIGSGPGGAVTAARLVERGAKVVVLEEGGAFTRRDFDMREETAYPRLYQERGARATADLAFTVLQGRALGGGTVVNWTTSLRVGEPVLAHWARRHGVEGLDGRALTPHFEAVERRLSVAPDVLQEINANNRALWDGCGKLGWSRSLVPRNVSGCLRLGYCGMGCPVDAKATMDRTYLADAVAGGATVYANVRAERIGTDGRRAVEVSGEVRDPATDLPTGRRVVVRPRAVVLSAGAINGPALLLRSGLDHGGRVGRRTFLHPVVASVALFPRPIEGWQGAPQSVASAHFEERGQGRMGFFVETVPIHPMLAGTSLGGFGETHGEVLSRLANAQAIIALCVDGFHEGDEGGTVALREDGRARLDYPISPALWEALREGNKALARIQLAAGAERVLSLHDPPVELRSEADLARLDAAPWEPMRVSLFSAHPMGGCAMGGDPARSVVDSSLRARGLDNLWVVDGSVFPTSLGVNPQLTIAAVARWASDGIAARAG
ncbi:MAG TPA: GMC family oxidoreductase [Anaeromyxobacteraceae bacterium]|nr:GMC family oxidoreductase [Anaeromyxobacteraceae bacterium]